MEEIENVCIVRYGKLEINFFLLSRRIFCRELGRIVIEEFEITCRSNVEKGCFKSENGWKVRWSSKG